MLGFMIVTAFLSFWISNTACTAMMLPVVTAVVNQLNAHLAENAHDSETKKKAEKSIYQFILILGTNKVTTVFNKNNFFPNINTKPIIKVNPGSNDYYRR